MVGCWRFACLKPTSGAAADSEKFITAILSAASTHCPSCFCADCHSQSLKQQSTETHVTSLFASEAQPKPNQ